MRNKKKKRKTLPLCFYAFQLSQVKTNIYGLYICGGSKWLVLAVFLEKAKNNVKEKVGIFGQALIA
jgi:hypothetical protein